MEKWKDDTETCDAHSFFASASQLASAGARSAFSFSVPYTRTSSRALSFIGPALGSVCWKTRRRPPLCSKSWWAADSAAPSAASGFFVCVNSAGSVWSISSI